MPKRVLDGEGLWRSDKLADVQPASRRAEFANLIPLAMANGTFEAGARRIWSAVYSYNRPDFTDLDVSQMLEEFERVKLLFRWTDLNSGKVWGYWVGIDKPGRLPGKSRWGKNEAIGPEPPVEALRKFLDSNGIQVFPNGNENSLGLGSGLGLGKGSGRSSGADAPAATPHDQLHTCIDSRHGPIRDLIQELHLKQFFVKCPWDASEGKALSSLLASNPAWSEGQLASMVQNRFVSEGVNSARPRRWLPSLGDYAAGRLDRFGKLFTRSGNVTRRTEEDEQQSNTVIANAARRFIARRATCEANGMGERNVAETTSH